MRGATSSATPLLLIFFGTGMIPGQYRTSLAIGKPEPARSAHGLNRGAGRVTSATDSI